MRHWYKYILTNDDDTQITSKDVLPSQYRSSLGGAYLTDECFQSKENFFKKFYFGENNRFRKSNEYLIKHINRDEQGLSIACGHCINELYLIEKGYNIICSDLECYCEEETKKIFPNLNFVEYDVRKSPFEKKVDYIICLSFLYLFDEDELLRVFRNIAESLKPGGRFLVDPGGSEDNIFTFFVDEILCKQETRLKRMYKKILKKEQWYFVKKHHGYRIKNSEIIDIAKKAGLAFNDVCHFDFITELKGRSYFFNKLPDQIVDQLGRKIPYVRLLNFTNTN